MKRTFPLSPGGAAAPEAALIGAAPGLAIKDRTDWPRFGAKGPGAADWMTGAWAAAGGGALPAVNRIALVPGLRLLRLGGNDLTILGDAEAPAALAAVRAAWDGADGARGWSSWREEGWAWLHLSGPALPGTLARLCAIDLRPGRFSPTAIAQTRFAGHDAVVLCGDGACEALFDVTVTASVLHRIVQAAGAAQTIHGGGMP